MSNPDTTCLAGALAGVGGVTNATGLGTLNTVLGLRNEALATWTMAPDDAIEAWRARGQALRTLGGARQRLRRRPDQERHRRPRARAGLLLRAPRPRTRSSSSTRSETASSTATCPRTSTAKIIIVERGAIRIKDGTFTGVVYALNKQECGSDGECSAAEREDAVPREVVRIDGNAGKVTGSVWADGAGGAVGIYPSLLPPSASATRRC